MWDWFRKKTQPIKEYILMTLGISFIVLTIHLFYYLTKISFIYIY